MERRFRRKGVATRDVRRICDVFAMRAWREMGRRAGWCRTSRWRADEGCGRARGWDACECEVHLGVFTIVRGRRAEVQGGYKGAHEVTTVDTLGIQLWQATGTSTGRLQEQPSTNLEWRAAPSQLLHLSSSLERHRPGEGRCWINLGGWQLVTNHSRKCGQPGSLLLHHGKNPFWHFCISQGTGIVPRYVNTPTPHTPTHHRKSSPAGIRTFAAWTSHHMTQTGCAG